MRALVLLVLALLVGCAAAPVEADPCPVPAELKSGPRFEVWQLDTRALDLDTETAALRAAAWWNTATLGRVSFRAMLAGEEPDCSRPTVWFGSDDKVPASEEMIARHVADPAPSKCVSVYLSLGWATTPAYRAIFERTKVSPWAAILAHELGHVLGLGHASVDDRTIMVPSAGLAKVSTPTCQDVSALAVLWGEPLPCREPAL